MRLVIIFITFLLSAYFVMGQSMTRIVNPHYVFEIPKEWGVFEETSPSSRNTAFYKITSQLWMTPQPAEVKEYNDWTIIHINSYERRDSLETLLEDIYELTCRGRHDLKIVEEENISPVKRIVISYQISEIEGRIIHCYNTCFLFSKDKIVYSLLVKQQKHIYEKEGNKQLIIKMFNSFR